MHYSGVPCHLFFATTVFYGSLDFLLETRKVPFCTLVSTLLQRNGTSERTGIWMMWQYILFVLWKSKFGGVEWERRRRWIE